MKAAKSDVKIGDVVVLKICASTSAVAASEIARKSLNVRYVTSESQKRLPSKKRCLGKQARWWLSKLVGDI